MNKRILYIISPVIFLTFTAFVIVRYQHAQKAREVKFYHLKERTGVLAQNAEWSKVKQTANELIRVTNQNPGDIKASLALATVYLQEARVTGDYMYYDAAAMKYIHAILSQEPKNFNALSLKALVEMSQHHFADGLVTASAAKEVNPYNAFVYGTLVDGHVEMGDYKAAVENADKMISLRPDLRSYSRVSYLREIYGDYPGAIEAMKMAVDAGPAGDETTAWTRVQLGHLYELSGDLANANMNYTIALEERPGYANALAGLGSLAIAAQDYPTAINYYEQASKTVMDYTYKESLVDLYRITGNDVKATELANSIIETMTANAEAGLKDPTVGHYSDRELAYAFLKINDNDKALEHALAEYNRRPENIDVNETLAWVYYAKGEYSKALPYMEVALKTNSRNPVLLSRAGLIYQAVHNNPKAKACLQAALEHDASFDMNLKAKANAALRSL